jgi:hypothetical protein
MTLAEELAAAAAAAAAAGEAANSAGGGGGGGGGSSSGKGVRIENLARGGAKVKGEEGYLGSGALFRESETTRQLGKGKEEEEAPAATATATAASATASAAAVYSGGVPDLEDVAPSSRAWMPSKKAPPKAPLITALDDLE